VGWKMNRWEVGRGVLVKGESVHGGLFREEEFEWQQQVVIGCVRGGMFQVRSVGSECGS